MTEWLKGLNSRWAGVVVGAWVLGVGAGAALDGWLTLPREVAALTIRQSADSLITMQNQRSITDLRLVTALLTDGQDELLELVRTIDRRTCISSASNETDLVDCANR